MQDRKQFHYTTAIVRLFLSVHSIHESVMDVKGNYKRPLKTI